MAVRDQPPWRNPDEEFIIDECSIPDGFDCGWCGGPIYYSTINAEDPYDNIHIWEPIYAKDLWFDVRVYCSEGCKGRDMKFELDDENPPPVRPKDDVYADTTK